MSFRAIKDTARARLHQGMKVETLCYAEGPTGPSVTVFCRVNSKDDAVGDLAGTSLAYAERTETIPKLIFLADEHVPVKGNVYSVSAFEVYRVDHLEPQDGITITAVVTRVSKNEMSAYAPPGG